MLRLFILFFIGISQLFAQNKSDLEAERRRLEKEINLTQDLLKETRNYRTKSQAEVRLLNNQIKLRERKVANLDNQVKSIGSEIERMSEITYAMEKEIEETEREYLYLASITYKSQNSLSVLLWLLSSESFSQAYDRLRYFKYFSSYRDSYLKSIKKSQRQLKDRKSELEGHKKEKFTMLDEQLSEAKMLTMTKEEKDEAARKLREKEKEYREQINQYRANMAKIQEAIEGLIRKETTTSSTETKEMLVPLSKLFEKNKGKLPWPVPMNKAVITSKFGVNDDDSGGKITNNGIYIATSSGQSVRAVFGGKVTAVQTLPVFGKVVIIQHGNYRTVYANLQTVSVKIGQEVEALSDIGIVKTNEQTGEHQLHFLIYEGKNAVNPESWINDKN